ncbi:reverse transcriptase domain-containing protein [bacterium]|nr:reverse transcriptase domain-containing protein [bacterium]
MQKGDAVRSRWVARDFKPKGEKDRADLFAAMPPLEAKRMLFRLYATHGNRQGGKKQKMLFIDVKKAHLNPACEYDYVFVELPAEANAPGKCGRLRRWLYGMRGAASSWEAEYTAKLRSCGFVEGKSAPTVFFNPSTGTRVVVHGDDFTFLGEEVDLRKMIAKMEE